VRLKDRFHIKKSRSRLNRNIKNLNKKNHQSFEVVSWRSSAGACASTKITSIQVLFHVCELLRTKGIIRRYKDDEVDAFNYEYMIYYHIKASTNTKLGTYPHCTNSSSTHSHVLH